jgi:DNA-binding CsgD family transcriptional regulator
MTPMAMKERARSRLAKPAPDILSIIEAAYAVEASTQEWTRGLLDATARALGAGLGGFACEFRATTGGGFVLDRTSAALANLAPEMATTIFDGLTSAPPGWLSSYLSEPRSASFCAMTSEVDPAWSLEYRAGLARDGVHDGINIVCSGLDRSGIVISLGVGEGERVTDRIRRSLVRVATHVAAAMRLRRKGGAALSQCDELRRPREAPEAIFSPAGKVLHATGEAELAGARRALESAVRNIEHARTSLRGNVDEALTLWRGLVSSRWTLVDQFDAHGVKYVVARENLPTATTLPGLTPTERCAVAYAARGYTTKEIAYALGVRDATVRVLLMRAARRCGVGTRRELLQLAVAAARESDPRDVAAGIRDGSHDDQPFRR